MSCITYQDFLSVDKEKIPDFIAQAIEQHKRSDIYQTALDADLYDHLQNSTINNFVKTILNGAGQRIIDATAANAKIASNFFHRLNVQRNMYSLGNGVTFQNAEIKKKLGAKFDSKLQDAGHYALIHGITFLYWNVNEAHVFPITEFVPLWDENTGALNAGIRFWQIAQNKPMQAVLYTLNGWSKYRSEHGAGKFVLLQSSEYKNIIRTTNALGDTLIGTENYSSLPIIPFWGSKLKQSTLVGLKQSIDSYDLIRSGFANDLTDCAQIYWIVANAGGMNEEELSAFREKLLFRHIANVDSDGGASVTPYTQEIPFQARTVYLDHIRRGIFEDFGALDVSGISASAKTATEINAAYQSVDENADDYEFQIISAIEKLLALQGITGDGAVPQFRRNRVANQKEQTEMVMLAASYLDDETILNHLPWLTPEEVEKIMTRKTADDLERLNSPEYENEEISDG